MRKFTIILILLLLSVPLGASNIPTAFYVDTTGSDSNTGLATDNAWASVAKVNVFSRTNLALRSEDFSTTWVNARTTESLNQDVAPDGTATADRLVCDDTATNDHWIYQQNMVLDNNTVYTASGYVKAGVGTYSTWAAVGFSDTPAGSLHLTWVNLSTGAIGTVSALTTGTVTSIDNGWYRVTATANAGTGTTAVRTRVYIAEGDNDLSFSGDNTSYISVWGAQFEAGSLPTPYIPTTTAPVTASFQPGDSILFKRGETWEEQIVVPSSGTEGNVITYGSYGTGAAPAFSDVPDENGQTYITFNFTGSSLKFPNFITFPSFPSFGR